MRGIVAVGILVLVWPAAGCTFLFRDGGDCGERELFVDEFDGPSWKDDWEDRSEGTPQSMATSFGRLLIGTDSGQIGELAGPRVSAPDVHAAAEIVKMSDNSFVDIGFRTSAEHQIYVRANLDVGGIAQGLSCRSKLDGEPIITHCSTEIYNPVSDRFFRVRRGVDNFYFEVGPDDAHYREIGRGPVAQFLGPEDRLRGFIRSVGADLGADPVEFERFLLRGAPEGGHCQVSGLRDDFDAGPNRPNSPWQSLVRSGSELTEADGVVTLRVTGGGEEKLASFISKSRFELGGSGIHAELDGSSAVSGARATFELRITSSDRFAFEIGGGTLRLIDGQAQLVGVEYDAQEHRHLRFESDGRAVRFLAASTERPPPPGSSDWKELGLSAAREIIEPVQVHLFLEDPTPIADSFFQVYGVNGGP